MRFRNYLGIFLLIFLSLKAPKQYHFLTGGFRLSSCQTNLSNRPEWETNMAEIDLQAIFDQPFSFCQRGSQAYVFISQDKQYMLKIFAKPLRKYVFPYKLSFPFVRSPQDPYLIQMERGIQGYKLGSLLPKKATGLLYLHLNTTSGKLPSISLRDAFGRSYKQPLDSYRFVLQKKCELLAPTLKKSSPQERKNLIQSYFDAISLRVSLGIRNRDTEFKRNFGILDGKVIEFDCGEFTYDPSLLNPSEQSKELTAFKDQLYYWTNKHI
jgi:hypothetical protein